VVERINQLYIMDGKNRNTVNKLVAGDIGATVKLKNTQTNHTLNTKGETIVFKPMTFPGPRIRTAIEAKNKQHEDKLSEVIKEIHEEDPTVEIEFSKELRQLLLYGQGELHLAVTRWRLEHIYGIEVDFISPKISYRETIQRTATSNYRHKKQSGGAGQFAEVTLTIMPYNEGMEDPVGFNIRKKEVIELEWGGKLVFYNCIVGGVIDARFLPSVLKGIMDVMEEAPLTQSYARDICVLVHDGKMHAVDSNDISFKIAGNKAFKEAFIDADPKLMEPVWKIEVLVPDDLTGEVMTDLQSRRALITGIDSKGMYQAINAKVPLAELDRYSTSLKSITQGRASFTLEPTGFEPVPYDVQEQLVKNNILVEEA
jgi:elongation factor G